MGGIATRVGCARVHHRRRVGGAGRHGELRRSAHLAEAARRHPQLRRAARHQARSAISSAPSTRARAKKNGSAPSRSRRRQRASTQPSSRLRLKGQRRRHQDRQHAVHGRRAGARAAARRRRATACFSISKFHDIPHQVAGAVASATKLGVWMMTVHASGGSEMLKAAKRAAVETAARLEQARADHRRRDGADEPRRRRRCSRSASTDRWSATSKSLRRSRSRAGLDGVVASPHELKVLRARFPALTIVTPGIRASSAPADDQSRTLSASEALAAGASYLVVGRPIVAAADPRGAAEDIARSCA